MRGYTFISKQALMLFSLAVLLLLVAGQPTSFASELPSEIPSNSSTDKKHQEEDDFAPTPFSEYGEFNEEDDEEADAKFFKHGRFFGFSVGLGMQTADGNRGTLWQGGLPAYSFRLHYWFDFNLSLDLGVFVTSHYYERDVLTRGLIDVNYQATSVSIRYNFDTRNLSAPITFANPFVSIAVGSYKKTEINRDTGDSEPDTSVGVGLGGGFEFVMSPKKLYFNLEAKMHIITFTDTHTSEYQRSQMQLNDLTGNFYSLVGSLLFTW